MYEATDLLLRRRPLQPDVPAFLWQVGNLESRLHTERVSLPRRFERFVAYLRNFYAAEHPVIAIYAAPHPLLPADTLRCNLGELPAHAGLLHAGFSLFVPAVAARPIRDAGLLADMDDPDHLRRITR